MSQQLNQYPAHDLIGNALNGFSFTELFSRREDSLSAGDLKINTSPCKAFDLRDSKAFPLRLSERMRHTEVFHQ